MSASSSTRALLLCAAMLLTSCGGGAPTGTGTTPPPPPPPPTNVASVSSGGTQTKPAESASDPMIVHLATSAGVAVSGASVTWSSTGGTLATTSSTTDASGNAQTTLTTVGTTAGTVTVTAAAGTASASFTVTVTAPPPGKLEKVGADPTNAAAGAADSVRVRVLDASNNPRAGANVTFAVTAGGGTVSPATVTTNALGVAATQWTRGGAGLNTITASSVGLTGSPVTFSVTAVSSVASVAFAAKVIVLDAAATATATAVAKDGSGAAMTGQTITYVSRTPTVASVSASGVVTGVAAGQSIIVASVTSGAGTTYRDSLLAVVAVPGGPVVLTDLARFDLKTDTTFTVAVFVDMRTSTDKLGSGLVKVAWDPALLVYQSDAEGGSSVGATVNATAVGTGLLQLGFASSAGFSGKVELRRITFKAASSAKSGSLMLTTTQAFAATTYTDILAKVVSVTLPLFTR